MLSRQDLLGKVNTGGPEDWPEAGGLSTLHCRNPVRAPPHPPEIMKTGQKPVPAGPTVTRLRRRTLRRRNPLPRLGSRARKR